MRAYPGVLNFSHVHCRHHIISSCSVRAIKDYYQSLLIVRNITLSYLQTIQKPTPFYTKLPLARKYHFTLHPTTQLLPQPAVLELPSPSGAFPISTPPQQPAHQDAPRGALYPHLSTLVRHRSPLPFSQRGRPPRAASRHSRWRSDTARPRRRSGRLSPSPSGRRSPQTTGRSVGLVHGPILSHQWRRGR